MLADKSLEVYVAQLWLTRHAAPQNGINPTDTFDPIKELRRARAANAGQKLVDGHAKQEAVLGAALNAHGDDSANLDQDNVDVSLFIIVPSRLFSMCLDGLEINALCCPYPLREPGVFLSGLASQ